MNLCNKKEKWESLPGANTLAYYEHLDSMGLKSFITLGPVVNLIKPFS
jgi:hypothetical protein